MKGLHRQDQRWQYIGLPPAEDFTFCRQASHGFTMQVLPSYQDFRTD